MHLLIRLLALASASVSLAEPTTVQKMDCFPDSPSPSQIECQERRCVYDASHPPGHPVCHYDLQKQGYRVQRREDTARGFRVHLRSNQQGPFPKNIDRALVNVDMLSDHILRITFDDEANANRYKVPVQLNLPSGPKPKNPKYKVVVTGQDIFSFKVVRAATNTAIWDTGVGGLVLSDQFLQLSTALPSPNVYGLGETVHEGLRLDLNSSWPAFARDQPPGPGQNAYGVHPFYTCLEDSLGHAHGVLLHNSNAQDFTLSSLPMLTYRTTGGILDFYFFFGPSPEEVVQQYTGVIGRPVMPPYWGLGFQLSRYGYNSIGALKEAVETTKKNGIPHDVQYADIDYMDENRDFTVDNVNFAGLNDYFRQLQTSGMRTIVMLDPCLISNNTNYEPYEAMKRVNGNVKWPSDVTPPPGSADTDGSIFGYVWPRGKVVFPDFFKNKTRETWKELILKLKNTLSFDGLWIDMNEPASFGTNEQQSHWSLQCPHNDWEDPPYRSKAAYLHDSPSRPARLSDKTLCMSSVQGESGQYRHYDVHSLYGHTQATITKDAAVAATGERSMVISRSTFPGSGRHVAHWLGDNVSNWPSLRQSITGILDFNLFGIPFVGADICGFFDDSSPELCKRWMQLGAFYTFARNHNTIGKQRQDPGSMGEEVARASREIMETRYWLLPYLYTLFHQAHTQGNTVIRPVHHEFPTDPATFDLNRQFLWGPALLISPILEEGQTSLTFYVPAGHWYDFFSSDVIKGPTNVTRPVASDSKPALLVRGGHVLPLQKPALNTALSRKNPMKLLVALSDQGTATGTHYRDDGVSVDTFENGKYYLAHYNATSNSLSVQVVHDNVKDTSNLTYSDVQIHGVTAHVQDVTINGEHGANEWQFNWDYDPDDKVLKLTLMSAPLSSSFTVNWTTLEESVLSRVDCWPERQGGLDVPDMAKCRQRSCVYRPHPHPAVPDCFFPQQDYGYRVEGPVQKTSNGVKINLRRIGTGPFGYELSNLDFTVEEYGNSVIRFKFDSPHEDRYTVPMELNLPTEAKSDPQYRFEVTSNDTFAFRIVRASTGAVLFDTGVGGLVFHDQFLQVSSRLASRHVYGMGENVHATFRRDLRFHTYPLFAKDEASKADNTLDNHRNNYGTHPFYQCVEKDGNAHGVLFFNSNPQDYTFTPLPMITYRTIGGILDFYVFLGPSPENVVQQYTSAIGFTVMPPYWSFGFQLCKYGYNSLNNLKAAVERTKAAGIPHDVQYADIDHFSGRLDFTLDNSSFQGLPDYFQQLRDEGMRTIIILDPALISNNSGYEPYERVKAVHGFIKWPQDPDYFYPHDSADDDGSILGYVWPQGKVAFPDFFNTETTRVWKELIVEHRKRIPFDGLWIDMNEPAVFGTNDEKPFNWPADVKPYWSLKCPIGRFDDPPYRTGASFEYDNHESKRHGRLSDKTLCLSSVQGDRGQYRHYDVHNLYGWSETAPTLEGLRQAAGGERGLVISRSTFVGSGHYAAHWLGDNASGWKDLRASIVGILEFNLYGFSMTGADICGHFGTASFELCKRWMQLGAFYSFSRNHNAIGERDQDPGSFNEEISRLSREAMETRYWLLPYLYTLMHFSHTRGNTVLRPVHHEFSTDKVALGLNEQFMWGPALLISPIIYPNVTELTYYLPEGRWYDFYKGTVLTKTGKMEKTIHVESDTAIQLSVRGGYILPMQEPARNTTYSRRNPLKVIVALNGDDSEGGEAQGSLFWDDGTSVDTYENGNYYFSEFKAANKSLQMTVVRNSNVPDVSTLRITAIDIWGVTDPGRRHTVYVNGVRIQSGFSYDAEAQILRIRQNLQLRRDFAISWS